jgi:hypothetical protein
MASVPASPAPSVYTGPPGIVVPIPFVLTLDFAERPAGCTLSNSFGGPPPKHAGVRQLVEDFARANTHLVEQEHECHKGCARSTVAPALGFLCASPFQLPSHKLVTYEANQQQVIAMIAQVSLTDHGQADLIPAMGWPQLYCYHHAVVGAKGYMSCILCDSSHPHSPTPIPLGRTDAHGVSMDHLYQCFLRVNGRDSPHHAHPIRLAPMPPLEQDSFCYSNLSPPERHAVCLATQLGAALASKLSTGFTDGKRLLFNECLLALRRAPTIAENHVDIRTTFMARKVAALVDGASSLTVAYPLLPSSEVAPFLASVAGLPPVISTAMSLLFPPPPVPEPVCLLDGCDRPGTYEHARGVLHPFCGRGHAHKYHARGL